MMREGIERGGYRNPGFSVGRGKLLWERHRAKNETLVTVDAS